MIKSILLFINLFFCAISFSQAPFEGIIEYVSVNHSKNQDSTMQIEETEDKIYIKGSYCKCEFIRGSGLFGDYRLIDVNKGTVADVFINEQRAFIHSKKYLKTNFLGNADIKVIKTNEAGEICGYYCNKYIETLAWDGVPLFTKIIWASDSLIIQQPTGKFDQMSFLFIYAENEIRGLPLKIISNNNSDPDLYSVTVVTKITPVKLDQATFEIPKGFKKIKHFNPY